MVGWQRHLGLFLRHVQRRASFSAGANYSASAGDSGYLLKLWQAPSPVVTRPVYWFLQQSGISSSGKLLAEETPVASPLSPALITSGKTEDQKALSKPSKVQAVLKGIKQSPKKVNLVAALVRGMRVEDALLQLQVTVKRAAKTVYQVILLFLLLALFWLLMNRKRFEEGVVE